MTANGDDVSVTSPNEDFSGWQKVNIRRTDSRFFNRLAINRYSRSNKNDVEQHGWTFCSNCSPRYQAAIRLVFKAKIKARGLVFNDGDPAKTPVTPDASRPRLLDATASLSQATPCLLCLITQQLGPMN